MDRCPYWSSVRKLRIYCYNPTHLPTNRLIRRNLASVPDSFFSYYPQSKQQGTYEWSLAVIRVSSLSSVEIQDVKLQITDSLTRKKLMIRNNSQKRQRLKLSDSNIRGSSRTINFQWLRYEFTLRNHALVK